MIAYKFLSEGRTAPFTGFRWPRPGRWVDAPASREDFWVHACRPGDLPYWLDDELWRIELDAPVHEARYQVSGPRGRLVEPISAWADPLRRDYALACAFRARDLALPHLDTALRDAIATAGDLAEVAAASARSSGRSRPAAYLADAARSALRGSAPATSYIACALAASLGGGLPAFEAERAWQARWLSGRLALGPGGAVPGDA